MKRYGVAWVSMVCGAILLLSGGTYGYQVVPEYGDGTVYIEMTEEGGYADAGYETMSWAEASAEIEYPESYAAGAAYVMFDWRIYTQDYDPQNDPTLTAHVTGSCICYTIASYDLSNSDYWSTVAAICSANGYEASAVIHIDEPSSGGVDTDYFSELIDMSYNGATVYFDEFALAITQASTTEDKVNVYAYAHASTGYWITEN
ncbi:MAG TPA: hypothetical protein PKH24_07150 [Sedimentisphaerales bacterium]|jgi:hypothetical protein|nr:hypothetical protein [Sedimentisphaerales bacterium]HNU29456.1 hypothetical protein [Sedimentisphaerales bacterium]